MKDPAEQWRQLTALYAEMGDTELRELKSSFEDLTELAQGVLRDELKKRALWDPPASVDDEREHAAATPTPSKTCGWPASWCANTTPRTRPVSPCMFWSLPAFRQ